MPCLRAGAATLACDHLPKDRDGRGRDAYGSVHKGNALDGARILLEPVATFGRHMRGVSYVFITKDRPGQLRAHGRPSKTPGKTFAGTLVVDDSETYGPDFALRFFAPKDDDQPDLADGHQASDLADAVYDVIAALPDHKVTSTRLLSAQTRAAGHQFRNDALGDAVADLIVAGRITEIPGSRGGRGYQAILTAPQEPSTPSAPGTAPAPAPLIGRGAGSSSDPSAPGAVGSSGEQSDGQATQ